MLDDRLLALIAGMGALAAFFGFGGACNHALARLIDWPAPLTRAQRVLLALPGVAMARLAVTTASAKEIAKVDRLHFITIVFDGLGNIPEQALSRDIISLMQRFPSEEVLVTVLSTPRDVLDFKKAHRLMGRPGPLIIVSDTNPFSSPLPTEKEKKVIDLSQYTNEDEVRRIILTIAEYAHAVRRGELLPMLDKSEQISKRKSKKATQIAGDASMTTGRGSGSAEVPEAAVRTDDERALRARLTELEYEYDLARTGLAKGLTTTLAAMLAGLTTLGAGLFAFIRKGPGFLSGTQLVVIFAILAFSIIIYFSFVFGRAARLRAEITETRKLLELSSGDNVRLR